MRRFATSNDRGWRKLRRTHGGHQPRYWRCTAIRALRLRLRVNDPVIARPSVPLPSPNVLVANTCTNRHRILIPEVLQAEFLHALSIEDFLVAILKSRNGNKVRSVLSLDGL